MKALLISLVMLTVIIYGVLFYFAVDNYKLTKQNQHQIDSLKKITDEKNKTFARSAWRVR